MMCIHFSLFLICLSSCSALRRSPSNGGEHNTQPGEESGTIIPYDHNNNPGPHHLNVPFLDETQPWSDEETGGQTTLLQVHNNDGQALPEGNNGGQPDVQVHDKGGQLDMCDNGGQLVVQVHVNGGQLDAHESDAAAVPEPIPESPKKRKRWKANRLSLGGRSSASSSGTPASSSQAQAAAVSTQAEAWSTQAEASSTQDPASSTQNLNILDSSRDSSEFSYHGSNETLSQAGDHED